MESREIPFGYVKKGKIFRTAWGNNPEREIGEVRKEDIEKSSQFFVNQFKDLTEKANELFQKIDEAENKGSFLMKLVHMKEQLANHDGLGDYQPLFENLTKYINLIGDIIQKNRIRNTEIKTSLIEETKQLDDIINWKEGTEKAHELKTRWIKIGNASEDVNEALESAFWELITRFFERKKQFYEDKRKLIEHRKKKYKDLIAEAHNLEKLFGKERSDLTKSLKQRWKDTGGISAALYTPLVNTFNELLQKGKSAFSSNKKVDYSGIEKKLNAIKNDHALFDKKELDALKKSMMTDRSRNPKKSALIELIQLLNEKDFVSKLAIKRFPAFIKMDKEKKRGIKKGIIQDLIQRDVEDLKIYEENSANFCQPNGSSMNKLVESKLKGHRKKIVIKEKLLGWVESGEF